MSQSRNVLMEINGKAANHYYGVLAPASFGGKTTFQLCDTRIIEKTSKIIATRHCEVILSKVDSVEIVEEGISWVLILGFMTLFLYGIGIIFIILYFIFKYKYLIIRSGSNALVLCISGGSNMDKAKKFMYEVLNKSEQSKPSK